ncbi:MAG: glycosyl hydrolase family 95 catalytic domain-containing protein [Oscillospiraceae bacterium]
MERTKEEMLQEVLWYRTPAETWTEALPVGNGRMGAMVFGGVNRDRLALNEESVWAGKPLDRINPQARIALPEVRELLFQGRYAEAEELAARSMLSIPKEVFPYQPLCDLFLETKESRTYGNYVRMLDLKSAEVETAYRRGGFAWKKTCFVSTPDQAIIYRVETEDPAGISCFVSMTGGQNVWITPEGEDTLVLSGWCDPEGIHFCAIVKVVAEGGAVSKSVKGRQQPRLSVDGASAVTLYVTTYTNARMGDVRYACEAAMAAVSGKPYETVRKDNRADYRELYGRFSLNLAASCEKEELSLARLNTASRLERIRAGETDHTFSALYFNYCRYLLIASARPGCLPPNRQGIWNDQTDPPWGSAFYLDGIFQAPFGCAEAVGLGSLHEQIHSWTVTGQVHRQQQDAAQRQYNTRGWAMHNATDLWGSAGPFHDLLGLWPLGGVWIALQLINRYSYKMDEPYLRDRIFPLIEGSVRFALDSLVEAPVGSACPGKLVLAPSVSPHSRYIAPDGQATALTYGCACDTQMITQLFLATLQLLQILSVERPGFGGELREELLQALERFPDITISPSTGGIQEWIDDFGEEHPGHRYMGQLFACYPGTLITPEKTPELAKAVEISLERLLSSDYDAAGWTLCSIASLYARLYKGEEAGKHMERAMREFLCQNLFMLEDGHPQVAQTMTFASAMLETLAQSHQEEIVLLPALPSLWPSGSLRGMRLKGNCILDMDWKSGLIYYARVYAPEGKLIKKVRTPEREHLFQIKRTAQEVIIQRRTSVY